MARLGEMLGFGDNPFYKAFDSNRNAFTSAFANMGADPLNPWAGWGQGFQRGADVDRKQAQLAAEQEEHNVTMEWVRANYPQYAGLPVEQAADLAFRAEAAKQGGGASQETFFGNIVPMQDENGNVILGQASNQGRWQPLQGAEGYSPAPTTKQIDAGNMIITTDVYGNELYRTPKSGDVPTGYGAPAGPSGAIAPMPGSPQDRELAAGRAQAERALTTLESKNQIALNAVDTALQQASGWNTGNVMGNSGWVPGIGQGALDLGKTLDTIKANIGFEELQTMRDNSPTGGALGQVTERELAFLQSTIANIEQSQSEEQLRRNLQTLRQFLAMSQAQRRAAFANQYGGGQSAPAQSGGFTILGVE